MRCVLYALPLSALVADPCLSAPYCSTVATALCGPINLTILNPAGGPTKPAIGDAVWGLINCSLTIAPTSTIVCPAPATFVQAPAGSNQLVIIDDAGTTGMGTSGTRIPYVGTIGTVSSSTLTGVTLTISGAQPVFSTTNVQHVAGLQVVNGGSLYEFSSQQTITCTAACSSSADGHLDAVGTPGVMTANGVVGFKTIGSSTLTIGATCTLTPTTQTAINGQITQIIGTITPLLQFQQQSIIGGQITNDSGTYQTSGVSGVVGTYLEPVQGCGFATPPMAYIPYTVVVEQLVPGTGIYQGTSAATGANFCNLGTGVPGVATTSPSDQGTNLTLICGGTMAGNGTFPGTVSFGTDNTFTFRQALGLIGASSTATPPPMNFASSIGRPECLYLPAGNYLTKPINGGTLGAGGIYLANGYGCWLGDEHFHTNVFVVPNFAGDVFPWLDSNQNSSLMPLGITQTFSNFGSASTANQAGATIRNITIIGDRLSNAPQNAIALYGKTEFAYINNVAILYMNGRAIYAGGPDVAGIGDFNESVIDNVRLEDDGTGPTMPGGATVPTMEITRNGGAEGSNGLNLNNIRIFQSFGQGMWIHNSSATVVNAEPRDIRMLNIQVEGSQLSATDAGGDLIEIGDPGSSIPAAGVNVSHVLGRNIELDNPVLGHAALHILGDTPGDTSNIDIQGAIEATIPATGTSYGGRGVQVETCGQCNIEMADNNTVDYNLMVGTSAAGGICSGATFSQPGLIYNGIGGEAAITSCIDPAAAGLVSYPVRNTLLTAVGTIAPVNAVGNLVSSDTIATGGTITVYSTGANPILPILPKYELATLIRTGPAAAFTDTLDNYSNFSNAFNPANKAGDIIHLRICNFSGHLETLAGNTGVNLMPMSPVIAPGACVPLTAVFTSTTLQVGVG